MIDLNCDAGEGFGIYNFGVDSALFEYVTSVNIACGFHAGDPVTIDKTIEMAIKNGLCIGAHPSFPDLMGFGRREMNLSFEEIRDYVIYQIGGLYAFVKAKKARMTHVKPHGAMYNMAVKDEKVARGIVEAVYMFDPLLVVVGLPESKLLSIALDYGLKVAREGFADRNYNDDGTLLSRNLPNAIIDDPGEIASRTLSMTKGRVKSVNGREINIKVETICIHSDSPNAVGIAKRIREEFSKHGIEVKGLGN
ncbi:MAG: LamB/YcsF family protein [Athalassotoga sp.]|uniref:LamB/YcsF family protein n=1 Tax=Athalassotoga sp. TaxID=2022597 RepID=UPI00175A451E|nr:LamB/YcsF family protein [Mesoaciditoga lauensis]